jgi:hypothetical protein
MAGRLLDRQALMSPTPHGQVVELAWCRRAARPVGVR